MRDEPITQTSVLSPVGPMPRIVAAFLFTVVAGWLITASFGGSRWAFWMLLGMLYLIAQVAVAIFVGRMIRGPE